MNKTDIFILAAEDSADVFGSNLLKELLNLNPNLKILGVCGPRMRKFNIKTILKMEDFHVMGFIDILFALPKLIKHFLYLRKIILNHNPKICIFIDYPDFNLRLEKSLRKKGYKNKLIHYVAPSVWAWRKKRTDFMAKYLDLLISIFPFEKKYFSHTNLNVKYICHPLAYDIIKEKTISYKKDLIGIFPGSRKKEIQRNFPLQLKAAEKLLKKDKTLKFAISTTNRCLIQDYFKKHCLSYDNFIFFQKEDNYRFMKKLKFAMATSGTITLELALNKVPTIVNFAIKPLDLFIIRKILKINLPFYCITNIIANKEIFFEFYGPNLKVNNLYNSCKKFLYDEKIKNQCIFKCASLIKSLKIENSNKTLANLIHSILLTTSF